MGRILSQRGRPLDAFAAIELGNRSFQMIGVRTRTE
jgi:hypothetical protein